MPNKILRFLIAGILVVGLIMVRYFESKFFYDPLIHYFKISTNQTLPVIDSAKLYAHILLRYMINLLLIVLIIKVLFWKKDYVKFTVLIGIIFLIILLPLYIYQLNQDFVWGKMIFFYTRRFLIQPMLLIILVPCFYYQEMKNKIAIN